MRRACGRRCGRVRPPRDWPAPMRRRDEAESDVGTVGWGTALILRANTIHSCRPMTMPTGTPMITAITAMTEACQAIVTANCRVVKPSVFNKARSRLRRRTDAIRVSARAAVAPKARPAARMTGVAPGGLIVDDLSRVLDAQDFDTVAGGIRVGRRTPCRRVGRRRCMSASPGGSADAAAEADEDHSRSVEVGVGLLGGTCDRRTDGLGEHGSGAHRGMLGEVARTTDGGHGRGSDDDQLGRREVERGGRRAAEGEDDGVADVLVQERERDGAQHDLVVAVDGVSGQDRWGDRRMVGTQAGQGPSGRRSGRREGGIRTRPRRHGRG